MKEKVIRIVRAAFAILLALSIFGCTTPSPTATPAPAATPTPAAATPAPAAATPTPAPAATPTPAPYAEYGMPIFEQKTTVSVFSRMDNSTWAVFNDLNESRTMQLVEEITNLHADFIIPPNGEEHNQLSLLISTQQLPDIII